MFVAVARCCALLLLLVWCAGVARAGDAPAGDAPRFDVLEFVIEGNSVLTTLAIERAVYPFLGERKSIADVDQARAALEKAYHATGFLTATVDIPEQKVEGGVVLLRVVEGSVDRLRITGSRYYSLGYIRARTPALAEGEVPYFPEVQQQLAQLSRSDDRRVTPVLKAGRSPGKVDVELKVDDRLPLHGSLELNDRYSVNTSKYRLAGTLRYENLWQREHSLNVGFQTAPENTDDAKVFHASYLFPTHWADTMVALYAVSSDSNVAAAGDIGVIGAGTIYGARLIKPLPGSPDYVHSLTLGIDYKNFDESVALQGADSFNTPVSYAPLLVQYSGTLPGERTLSTFNLAATLGIRDLFNSNDPEFANKRFRASANFFYLRADWQRVRTFEGGWAVTARVDAQLTGDPLISNEQFSAGGADSVRGYLESEVLGDYGARGKLEARSRSFQFAAIEPLSDLHAIAFWEGAHLRIHDALPGQQARFTLASAGMGLRARAWRALLAVMDVAWPFRSTLNTKEGSPRLGFRLTYEF